MLFSIDKNKITVSFTKVNTIPLYKCAILNQYFFMLI